MLTVILESWTFHLLLIKQNQQIDLGLIRRRSPWFSLWPWIPPNVVSLEYSCKAVCWLRYLTTQSGFEACSLEGRGLSYGNLVGKWSSNSFLSLFLLNNCRELKLWSAFNSNEKFSKIPRKKKQNPLLRIWI